MPSITVGSLTFSTKAEAERHIRQILEAHRPPVGTKPLSPEAHQFVLDLLELHPHKEIVCGSGVQAIFCQLVEKQALRFLIQRTDGTIWDVSWRHCLTPHTPLKRLLSVLRVEIKDQIDMFKGTVAFPVICPITGTKLNSSDCHIDHAKPDTFEVIVEDWLRITGYSPESIDITHKAYYGGRPSVSSRIIADQWKRFHQSRASLRAVSTHANLSVLRKAK